MCGSIEILLDNLQEMLNNSKYQEDKKLINKLLTEINSLKENKRISKKELDDLEEQLSFLEEKYDYDYELTNVFINVYSNKVDELKKEYISDLRTINKMKKENRLDDLIVNMNKTDLISYHDKLLEYLEFDFLKDDIKELINLIEEKIN